MVNQNNLPLTFIYIKPRTCTYYLKTKGLKILIEKVIETHLAWIILTLVFILGCDQLYAIEPAIPLSQRVPFYKNKRKY